MGGDCGGGGAPVDRLGRGLEAARGRAVSLKVPLGIDDFRKVRELGLTYVDKTHLVRELLDMPGAQVVQLPRPRPRRFGKSLNVSMLRCFFERREEDFTELFEGLAIAGVGERYLAHFQRYPVIHLTFKGAKHDTFEACWGSVAKKIEVLFREHGHVLTSGQLSEEEGRDFQAVLDGSAGRALYERALLDLSRYLHRVHGERVVILIDEYDEPIHAGHVHGYGDAIIGFFRAFLTEGLKGNPHLFRAVLTGILRVARESIFSGLNNLAVSTLLQEAFSTCFGFTEAEVLGLLEAAGRTGEAEVVRHWYDGYLFGRTVIYNPWSVLNFLHWQKPGDAARPYWVSTSSNDLVKQLLEGRAARLEPVFEALLAGEGIERVLDENVVLEQLERSDDALWSLLVFSGYLKAEERRRGQLEQSAHYLTIPNQEVRLVYSGAFREWMHARMSGHGGDLERLTRGLLGGDAEVLEEELQAFVENLLSYHDGAVRPEQVYQGFVIGLLAVLEPGHRVRSNRESGRGRPDVLVIPAKPGMPGVVLELKVAKAGRKTLEQALEEGVAQIGARGYAAELEAAAAEPVYRFAVAFDGKVVRVRAG